MEMESEGSMMEDYQPGFGLVVLVVLLWNLSL